MRTANVGVLIRVLFSASAVIGASVNATGIGPTYSFSSPFALTLSSFPDAHAQVILGGTPEHPNPDLFRLARQIVSIDGALTIYGVPPPIINIPQGWYSDTAIADFTAVNVTGQSIQPVAVASRFLQYYCPYTQGCSGVGAPINSSTVGIQDQAVKNNPESRFAEIQLRLLGFYGGQYPDLPTVSAVATGTVTVQNQWLVWSPTSTQSQWLEEAAIGFDVAGATLALGGIALLVGASAPADAFLLPVLGAASSLAGLADSGTTLAESDPYITAIGELDTQLSGQGNTFAAALGRLGIATSLLSAGSSRLANDPPRSDYMVESTVPLPGSLSPAFRMAYCMNASVTALERYQGAALAGNEAAGYARLGDHKALEECLLESAQELSDQLGYLLASDDLPLEVDLTNVRSFFASIQGDSVDLLSSPEIVAIAGALGVSVIDVLEMARSFILDYGNEAGTLSLLSSSSASVGVRDALVDLRASVDKFLNEWTPVVGVSSVPTPGTASLVVAAIALALGVGRRLRQRSS